MNVRQLLKLFAPPVLVQGYHAIRDGKAHTGQVDRLYLSGDYDSWAEALADSTGYDAEIILERTRAALLKVKNHEAVYERDSVLFEDVQYSWPLLAGLMWVAARSGGRLNVLDFGGSLGTTYFQNRSFLSGLRQVRWNIVEQARHVETGKQWFENDQLRFYARIEECLAETEPQVIVLSSVLQYLSDPYDKLNELLNSGCDHIIIDRTPFWDGPTDRLCLQHVPAEIYPASYPSWVFSRRRFASHLTRRWNIICEFRDPDKLPGPVHVVYCGLIATRRERV
jgi:putative methyltransferase (TIGR04325 family)